MAHFTGLSSSVSQEKQRQTSQGEQHLQEEQHRQRQNFINQHSQGPISFSSGSETYPDPGLYTTYPYVPQNQQYQQNDTTAVQLPTHYQNYDYTSSYQHQHQQQPPVSFVDDSTSEMHSEELTFSFLDGPRVDYPYDLFSSSYEADPFTPPSNQISRPAISQNDQLMFDPPYVSPQLKDFPTQSLGDNHGVTRFSKTTTNTTANTAGIVDPIVHIDSYDSKSFAMDGHNREKLGKLDTVDQRPKLLKRDRESFKRIFVNSAPKTSQGWKTPLDEGMVTEEEAKTLFSIFMDRLNPACSILDPMLHTHDWTRSTSPILYTAILMAATQITLVDRHTRLRIYAKSLSGLAFAEGVCEIGLCQALFLIGFWRRTDEGGGGAWRLVGYAIRVAYELGLHREHVRPLPEDPLQARLVLDKERTFYALTAFENLLEIHHSLPGMADRRAVLDPCLWIGDHPKYANSCDQHTASIWELTTLYWGLNTLNSSKDAKVRSLLVERGRDQMERWKEKWKVSRREHSDESPDPEAHLYQLLPASQLLINHCSKIAEFDFDLLSFFSSGTVASSEAPMFYLSLVDDKKSEVVPPNNFAGIKCFFQTVESALKVVRGIEDLRPVLGVMHELTYVGTTSATVWLAKNFNQLPAQYNVEFLDALYTAQDLCQIASSQPFDLCTCQAQFFQSVLLVLARSKGDTVDQSVNSDGRVNFSWHSSDQQNSSSNEQEAQWPRSFIAVDADMMSASNMTVSDILDIFNKIIPPRPSFESMF